MVYSLFNLYVDFFQTIESDVVFHGRYSFGKILRGELPCDKVFEDDRVLVFKDIAPVSDFHLLVIPKEVRDATSAANSGAHRLGEA